MLTCNFQCFYHPDNDVAPLQRERIVPVGYGNQGGDPFRFCKNDVAFFKIFVTSEYVDMSSVTQDSIFSKGNRGTKPIQHIGYDKLWESWIYVVGD